MNAYLFTAITTMSQLRPTPGRHGPTESFQTWDGCSSLIVLGDNPDEAQKKFEACLHMQREGENPMDTQIRKIAAAQFVDQLLTESGSAPLDWLEILRQCESTATDDFEQGHWVDVDPVVRPGQLSVDVEALQQDLPEEIRTGMNWSADKKFYFVLSVLTPPSPPADLTSEPETNAPNLAEPLDENPEALAQTELQRLLALFPQSADKEAAAMIQARNSVVAAWLWRRYAANTRLAANQIRIDPGCGVVGTKPEPSE